jgi:hypothetical protein
MNHTEMMALGVSQGWWEEFNDNGPIRVWRITLCDSHAWASRLHYDRKWRVCMISPCQFWSQLLTQLGFFKSVRDAKAAGWNKPLTPDVILLRLPLRFGGKGQERFEIGKYIV